MNHIRDHRSKKRRRKPTEQELIESNHESSIFGKQSLSADDGSIRGIVCTVKADNLLMKTVEDGFMAWNGNESRMLDRFDARLLPKTLYYLCL